MGPIGPGMPAGHSPLRSKSRSASSHRSPIRPDPPLPEPGIHSLARKTSNKSLKNQYFRQINLCKKSSLYFYEASILVGYLLDLINLSRNVEKLKQKLVEECTEFNLMDAFSIVQTSGSHGRVSQADFRETLLL